jgi:hypothetical protein
MSSSMVPIIVAIAASQAAKKRNDEEEKMAGYNKEDLDGWEFKIVRSAMGKFNKYQKVQDVCQEEALAGWELVEKFDDSRLRFKRRVDHRSRDSQLKSDPYRTDIGLGSSRNLIMISLGLLIAGILAFVLILQSGSPSAGGSESSIYILTAIITIGVLAIFLAIKRKPKS